MNKKKNLEKKEVHEIVGIEKDGKEKVKEFSGKIEEEPATKKEIKKENKQLKTILIIIGIISMVFILYMVFSYSVSHFTYEGVKFKIIKEGNIIFYNTAFSNYDNQGNYIGDYNFYLRNDPRKLAKEVPWNGSYVLLDNVVINLTKEFSCQGYGLVGVGNFINVHEFFGAKVIKDENATCDEQGRYMFVQIEEGNETKVEQYGPACFRISIKDCEILEGTERFIYETFSVAHENMKS